MSYQHMPLGRREPPYQSDEQLLVKPHLHPRMQVFEGSSLIKRKPLPWASIEPDYYPIPSVHLEEKDRLGANPQEHQPKEGAVWAPGFWKRLPLFSSLSLLGVVGCTAASVIVLSVSNESNVRNWAAVTPSVYLAIFSTIANTLMAFALAEGLAISYWRTMLNGCKLSELNRNWECGNNIQSALTQGYRRGGRVTAIARIVATLSLLRGPLYQKASTVDISHRESTQGSFELEIAREVPNDYTSVGVYSRVASLRETARLSLAFTGIMNDFSEHSNMTLSYSECGDVCYTTVQALGFKADCTKSERYKDYDTSNITGPTLFDTNVGLWMSRYNASNWLNVTAGITLNSTFYEGQKQLIGNTERVYLTYHVCNMTPGIVEYNIELTSGTIVLSARNRDRFVQAIDLVAPNYLGGNNTIGGFQYAGSYLFKSNAYLDVYGAVSATSLTGSLANRMLKDTNIGVNHYTFNDPMELMLDSMREIAFRTSLTVGRTASKKSNQSVAFTGTRTYSVYRTNWAYLVLAVISSIAGLVSVLATFHGWWRLGRDVSLNPLEVCKAFSAPLLNSAGSNVSFSRFPDHATDFEVRYGFVAEQSMLLRPNEARPLTLQLLVDEASRLHTPQKGQIFG